LQAETRQEVTPREKLSELMRMRDISGYALAEATKISRSHINGFLQGSHNKMTLENWIKIARVLDVSLDWLAGLPVRDKERLEPDEDELLRLWRKVRSGLIKETTFSTLRAAIALEELDELETRPRP